LSLNISLEEIAAAVGGNLKGDPQHKVCGCATLPSANATQLSFIYDKKYLSALKETKAGVVILSADFAVDCHVNALIVDNPYLAYAKAASLIHSTAKAPRSIHSSAVIGKNCSISDNCVISANVVIGDNVCIGSGGRIGPNSVLGDDIVIGENSHIVANVTITSGCRIGNDVNLHPGSVIGSDGFGYAPTENRTWCKIPQLGRVIIGNNVDIGANTTVDCGALDNTIIGNGVKIDNLVQIAHNVEIGDHSAIAGCTGIAGSTKIGKHCTFAGGVGLVGHLTIVDNVHVTGMTMVTHSIKQAGAYSSGTPFQKNSAWLKNAVRFKQLDALTKKINKLIKTNKEHDASR